jgi:AcrR family transcriptional regulator
MERNVTPIERAKGKVRGPVGRPASLTEQAIITAALRIGLDQLTIRKLAASLGVAPSTIYEYFASRDEIVAAAITESVSSLRLPCSTGTDWQDYVTEFAEAIVRNRVDHPEYVRFHLEGNDTSAITAELIRQFATVMDDYGFSIRHTLWLLQRLGALTLSAAVSLIRQRALGARGIDPALAESVVSLGKQLSPVELKLAQAVIDGSDAYELYKEDLKMLIVRFGQLVAADEPVRLQER